MQQIADQSPEEYFDMLKILKLLYYIEKPKKANDRIRITDILSKPRLGNILTNDSQTSIYGEVFQKLYNQIKSGVKDADKRCSDLEEVDKKW